MAGKKAKGIIIWSYDKTLEEGYLNFLDKVLLPLLEVEPTDEEIERKLKEICKNLGCEDAGQEG